MGRKSTDFGASVVNSSNEMQFAPEIKLQLPERRRIRRARRCWSRPGRIAAPTVEMTDSSAPTVDDP